MNAQPADGEKRAPTPTFEHLFETLREQVYAVCWHTTRNAADASDALQDTFLAVHTGLPKFRGECRISTWVHRIALCAANRVRSRRRAHADVAELIEHDLVAARQVHDPVEAAEESVRLEAALCSLSADHRAVLTLFAVEGLAHAEIAEILGVPEGTVWSRLHHARKGLAQRLDGPAGDHGARNEVRSPRLPAAHT
jgi:RNA polymerase sigma-70 factor (ECF subfamily)